MASQAAAPSVALADGTRMPLPGFGTWRCDVALLEDAVYHAIKTGYRHIDCAGLYRNEHIVGAGIKRAIADGLTTREELFVTSKLAPTQMEGGLVRAAVEKTISDLGVGYLNHYITHWPYAIDPACTVSPAPSAARLGYDEGRYLAVWRAMEAMVDAGLVRSLGCSNTTGAKLASLMSHARVKPVAAQVELHPFLSQPRLLAACKSMGVVLTGYCPLGSPGRPAAYRADGDPDVMGAHAVQRVAEECGKTPAQVVLKWAVMRGTVPLPRTTTTSRVEENWEGCTGGWALTDDQVATLDGLDASKGSVGRIMKGDNFAQEGVAWASLWDEGWYDANGY